MTILVDHSELETILENNININEAILSVAKTAGTGDIVSTMEAVFRSHQLILQALKSNTAIVNQIRARNFD